MTIEFTPEQWAPIRDAINTYAMHVAEAAMHQSASRADISHASALSALQTVRRTIEAAHPAPPASASAPRAQEAASDWTIFAPDGTSFTGESPFKAALAANRHHIATDPVASARLATALKEAREESEAEREQCMRDYGTLDCPACGGSGHIADAKASAAHEGGEDGERDANDFIAELAQGIEERDARILELEARLAESASVAVREALTSYLGAQDNLDNWECAGLNREDHDKVMSRRNAARRDLDAALAAAPDVPPAEVDIQAGVEWLRGQIESMPDDVVVAAFRRMEVAQADELPGMWDASDLSGGEADTQAAPYMHAPNPNCPACRETGIDPNGDGQVDCGCQFTFPAAQAAPVDALPEPATEDAFSTAARRWHWALSNYEQSLQMGRLGSASMVDATYEEMVLAAQALVRATPRAGAKPLTEEEMLLLMRIPVDAKGECRLDSRQRSLYMARAIERAVLRAHGIGTHPEADKEQG